MEPPAAPTSSSSSGDGRPARGARRRRRRRIALAVAVVVAATLTSAAAVASQGSLEIYGGQPTRSLEASQPSWVTACLDRPPRNRPLIARCARLRGRVVYVQREHTSSGALVDVHLAVLSHFHLVVVKLAPDRFRTPGVGDTVTAVGPLARVAHGLRELEAFAIDT